MGIQIAMRGIVSHTLLVNKKTKMHIRTFFQLGRRVLGAMLPTGPHRPKECIAEAQPKVPLLAEGSRQSHLWTALWVPFIEHLATLPGLLRKDESKIVKERLEKHIPGLKLKVIGGHS